MSKEPTEYLKHIQDEILFILSATEDVSDKEEFIKNETLKKQSFEVSKSSVKQQKKYLLILN